MEISDCVTGFVKQEKETLEKGEGFFKPTIFYDVNIEPEWEEVDLAFLTITEPNNGAENLEISAHEMELRNQLYHLAPFQKSFTLIDLGHLKNGNTERDALAALRIVLEHMWSNNIVLLIFSTNDFYYEQVFRQLKSYHNQMNFVSVSSGITYISEGSKAKDLYVDYRFVGYQSQRVAPSTLEEMQRRNLQMIRLGKARENLPDLEPELRDAHWASISSNSIRHADFTAQESVVPNGFLGEEICKLAHFSGNSDKIRLFSCFGYQESRDKNHASLALSAELLWYFLYGYTQRIIEDKALMKAFNVDVMEGKQRLKFYKSEVSHRWWMEVPVINQQPRIIACSYLDYQAACNNQIPGRWLNAYHRFN